MLSKNKKLKKSKSKKGLVVACVILLAVILGLVGYVAFVKDDSTSVSQEEQKAAEQADVDAAKDRLDEESQDEPLKDNTDGDSTPVTEVVALSNLSFSQSNGVVKASASVSGVDSGTCRFSFTDADGRAVVKTASISSGSCSVTASEAEFSMIGDYILSVKVGDKTISKTVSIS